MRATLALNGLRSWREISVLFQPQIRHCKISRHRFHLNHSNKKRKDSLITQVELTVLRAYVESQAIRESIVFYSALKYKQTKKQGFSTIHRPTFLPFCVIIISFFGF